MNLNLIRMFQCEVPGHEVDFNLISKRAIESGYLVEPGAATQDVLDFLEEQYINTNATFYKQWEDITDASETRLALNAIKHYLSTYGTVDPETVKNAVLVAKNDTVQVEYNTSGNGWVPNSNPIVLPLHNFKIIKAVTPEFVRDKILSMLESGIALGESTVEDCIEFFEDYNFLTFIDVNKIKNREAQACICRRLKTLPEDEFGMLRCIVYDCTKSAMLIKSPEVLDQIKTGFGNFGGKEIFNLELLSNEQLKKLSRIFYRYKPIFLALKSRRYRNAPVINKIRRLAKRNHTPLKKGFWEDILCNTGKEASALLPIASQKVKDINNFKKIQLMQAIRSRLIGANTFSKVYNIRNGKTFVKTSYKNSIDFDYLTSLYNILKNSVVDSLKEKATTFTIPEALHIACPTSEKNFLGNYPTGTWVEFADSDNVIGVYWRNEWGARDFDLHVVKKSGATLGWDSHYRNRDQTIVYSGDMTNADPEAAELFYFKQQPEDCYITLNCYNGHPNAKYRLFVARENLIPKFDKREDSQRRPDIACMCDPNNIIMEAMMTFNGDGQNNIAYIHNNKLHLVAVKSGRSRTVRSQYAATICAANNTMVDSFIDLVPLLEEAGFKKIPYKKAVVTETVAKKEIDVTGLSKEEALKKVEEAYKEPLPETPTLEPAELDFANIDKDTLIKLFA